MQRSDHVDGAGEMHGQDSSSQTHVDALRRSIESGNLTRNTREQAERDFRTSPEYQQLLRRREQAERDFRTSPGYQQLLLRRERAEREFENSEEYQRLLLQQEQAEYEFENSEEYQRLLLRREQAIRAFENSPVSRSVGVMEAFRNFNIYQAPERASIAFYGSDVYNAPARFREEFCNSDDDYRAPARAWYVFRNSDIYQAPERALDAFYGSDTYLSLPSATNRVRPRETGLFNFSEWSEGALETDSEETGSEEASVTDFIRHDHQRAEQQPSLTMEQLSSLTTEQLHETLQNLYRRNYSDLTEHEQLLLNMAHFVRDEIIQERGISTDIVFQDQRAVMLGDILQGASAIEDDAKITEEERQSALYQELKNDFLVRLQAELLSDIDTAASPDRA